MKECYRDMLTEFFFQRFDEIDSYDIYFQQDGATSHTAGITIDLLRQKFGDYLISRIGPFHWPPRSLI